jgi:hypothetical protein
LSQKQKGDIFFPGQEFLSSTRPFFREERKERERENKISHPSLALFCRGLRVIKYSQPTYTKVSEQIPKPKSKNKKYHMQDKTNLEIDPNYS